MAIRVCSEVMHVSVCSSRVIRERHTSADGAVNLQAVNLQAPLAAALSREWAFFFASEQ